MRRLFIVALLLAPAAARGDEVDSSRTTRVSAPHIEDSPARGARGALVTAEFFCNFAHVQCATGERVLRRLLERYPDGLRVVYRQVVLPFRDSQVVAEGAVEAWVQGRFTELADAVVARGAQLKGRDLEIVAARAGLDLGALRAALEDHRHMRRLEEDALRRELLGVGSLGIAWNGEPSAELSFESMERNFVRAQERAARRLAEGVPRERLHASLVREATAARNRTSSDSGRRRTGEDVPRARVTAGTSPVRGAPDAPVTIVAFTDFECAYCRRQEELLGRLLALYPDRIRVVYKHYPLAQHPTARIAAEASECGRLQGRFWDVHALLIGGGGRLRAPDLDRLATDAGLDVARMRADLAAGSCAAAVDADLAAGKALGVESTPTLFINGIKLVGLHSLGELRGIVEDETAPGVLSQWLSR